MPTGKRVLVAILAFGSLAAAQDPRLGEAHKLYNSTAYEQSLKVLQAIQAKDGAVFELMGRNYYMQADYKHSTEMFEKALASEPANSDFALWLGRAWGRRAETSGPFTAPSYATRARQFLEKSVQLNPMNLEAQSDLFEYYLEAPGFLGGGLDKAGNVAEQMGRISPAEGQFAQAKLAEKRKQSRSAEDHLRRAIALAPHQVGKIVELARFLTKQGRYQQAEQNFQHAEEVAPNDPGVIFARASTYVESHYNLQIAQQLLKRYMTMELRPDDPPKAQAAKLLRRAQGG